jgi:threonine dehydrogenase-like Zn-dependent dehydrogenase
MSEKLAAYKKAQQPLPEKYLAWELYGAGFEHLGKEGKPVLLSLPKFGPNELLGRVDAVSLCLSDTKVIKLGDQHPRLVGRDLVSEPVVLGHEVAITIMGVGEELKERFKVGERFVVQADAFWKGQSVAYGYNIRGGAAQYTVLTEVLHSGDDGSYLLPMQESTGYSEAALSEPWACVECSYHIHSRPGPKPHGRTWIIGLCGGDLGNYTLGEGFDYQGGPRRVLLTEVTGRVEEAVRKLAFEKGFEVEDSAPLATLLAKFEEKNNYTFDDIILLGKPKAELIERIGKFLGKDGHLATVCPEIIDQEAEIDIGRIHYDFLHYIGTSSTVVMQAYRGRRTSTLAKGGAAWIIGAGGPMGQMHLQRALDRTDGPRIVLATDVDDSRLAFVKERYTGLAEESDKRLILFNAEELTPQLLWSISNGEGFSDILIMAPVAQLAEEAWKYLATDGLLNFFAGVARGTKAKLRFGAFSGKGCRLVGSSGSALDDMRFTLAEAEAGRLATDKAVAAIGGINTLGEGLEGVAGRRFPGKVVIYPQLDFPLMPLSELKDYLPAVAGKLEGGQFWNREAEAALFEQLLK